MLVFVGPFLIAAKNLQEEDSCALGTALRCRTASPSESESAVAACFLSILHKFTLKFYFRYCVTCNPE